MENNKAQVNFLLKLRHKQKKTEQLQEGEEQSRELERDVFETL